MKEEIDTSIKFLEKGKIILCPTDTIWGLSCDATNFEAVETIFNIKKRDKKNSLIILVSNINMLHKYIEEISLETINKILGFRKPTTVIFPSAKNIAENIIHKNKSIAIRLVKEGFCHQLIETYGKAIVSTSANVSKEKTPRTYIEISEKILEKVSFIVSNRFESKNNEPSSIIKIEKNKIIFLRA